MKVARLERLFSYHSDTNFIIMMEFESENYYTMFCLCILFIISVTDTENIRFVFAAVKDTILQLNLKEYNLV